MTLANPNRTTLKMSALCLLLFYGSCSLAQPNQESGPLLTVKQLMNALIVPSTNTIWGAYQLQGDAQWQEVENAAWTVIAAGELLAKGGAKESKTAMAAEADWKGFNAKMIAAARQVLDAVEQRDEEALFAAGNDSLYPPCESCHQQYQQR